MKSVYIVEAIYFDNSKLLSTYMRLLFEFMSFVYSFDFCDKVLYVEDWTRGPRMHMAPILKDECPSIL